MKKYILGLLLTTITPCIIFGSEKHKIQLTKLIPSIINNAEAKSELTKLSNILNQKTIIVGKIMLAEERLNAALEFLIIGSKQELDQIKNNR